MVYTCIDYERICLCIRINDRKVVGTYTWTNYEIKCLLIRTSTIKTDDMHAFTDYEGKGLYTRINGIKCIVHCINYEAKYYSHKHQCYKSRKKSLHVLIM